MLSSLRKRPSVITSFADSLPYSHRLLSLGILGLSQSQHNRFKKYERKRIDVALGFELVNTYWNHVSKSLRGYAGYGTTLNVLLLSMFHFFFVPDCKWIRICVRIPIRSTGWFYCFVIHLLTLTVTSFLAWLADDDSWDPGWEGRSTLSCSKQVTIHSSIIPISSLSYNSRRDISYILWWVLIFPFVFFIPCSLSGFHCIPRESVWLSFAAFFKA